MWWGRGGGGSKKERRRLFWSTCYSGSIVGADLAGNLQYLAIQWIPAAFFCLFSKCFKAGATALFSFLFYFFPCTTVAYCYLHEWNIQSVRFGWPRQKKKACHFRSSQWAAYVFSEEFFSLKGISHDTGHFRGVCGAAAACVGTESVRSLSFNAVSTQCEILASSSVGALRLQHCYLIILTIMSATIYSQ